jgi:hypothetical protein
VVESSGLLNRRRALKLYRGFESLPLRQFVLITELGKLLVRPMRSGRLAACEFEKRFPSFGGFASKRRMERAGGR